MLNELLIAASALAGTTTGSTPTGPDYDLRRSEIVVEAGRGSHYWAMPELDFDEPDSCLPLIETQLPGFGTFSFGRDCSPAPADQSGWWPR